MKLLLDTHTFIWWDSEPNKLSETASALLQDSNHSLILSAVSVWEMQIKLQLGKLTLSLPLVDLIESQQTVNQIQILPMTLAHVLAIDHLPTPHKDPFDRLLIAQANVEGAMLVSSDSIFEQYPVQRVW